MTSKKTSTPNKKPPASPVEAVLGAGMAASLLKLQPRRLQELVAEKLIPKLARGKYELGAIVHAYIDYLREGREGAGTQHDYRTERARKEKVQADSKEFEFAIRQGGFVELADVRMVFEEAVVMLAAELDGTSGRIASGNSKLRDRLKDELDGVRTGFANRLEAFVDGHGGGSLGTATSKTRPVGVGRKRKRPAQRKRRARKV